MQTEPDDEPTVSARKAATLARRNALWLGPLTVLTAAINTWINIILARRLGVSGFGEWSLIVATASWINVLRTAVGSDLIVKGAADLDYAKRAFFPAAAALTIGSGAIGVVGVLWHVFVNPVSALTASIWMTGAFALGALSVIPVSLFAGQNKMQWNVVDSASSGCTLVGLILLGSGVDITTVGLTYLVSYGTVSVVSLAIAARSIRPQFERSIWMRALSFRDIGSLLAINWLIGLHWTVELFILDGATTDEAVGVYSAAFKLAIVFRLIPATLVMSVIPEVSRRMAVHDWRFIQFVWTNALRSLVVLSTLATLILLILSKELVDLIYRREFLSSSSVLVILAIALIPLSFASVTQSMLYATARYAEIIRVLIVALAIQMVAGFGLIPSLGAHGAAISFMTGELMLAVLYLTSAVRQFRSWPDASVYRTCICSAATVVLAILVNQADALAWPLSLAGCGAFYVVGLLTVGGVSVRELKYIAVLASARRGLEQ